jgi:hypothetical protein
MLSHYEAACAAISGATNHSFWQFCLISGTFERQVIEYEPDLDDTKPGQLISEIAMSASLMWTSLLLGNFALLMLWVHYIVKVLKGQCPHCGK